MRFERKFYAVSAGNAKTATDADINDMVSDFDNLFAKSGADWFEEETRFDVGTLTVIVFKLTWLEEAGVEAVYSDEKIEPVKYIFPGELKPVDGKVSDFDITTSHFSTFEDLKIRGEENKVSDTDYDDSWW